MSPWAWALLPAVGALIGWLTNLVAVRMLFHPRRRIGGFQGLLPRRQQELAASVGRVVGEELVSLESLLQPLAEADLSQQFTGLVDTVLERKIDELRKIPLIGGLLTPDRLGGIKQALVSELVKAQPALVGKLREIAEERVDIGDMARERLASFDLDRLEQVVKKVAAREFRAIERWGAILGLLVGLGQAALLSCLAAG